MFMSTIWTVLAIATILVLLWFYTWAKHHQSDKDKVDVPLLFFGGFLLLVGWALCATPAGQGVNWVISSMAPSLVPLNAPDKALVEPVKNEESGEITLNFKEPAEDEYEWLVQPEGGGPQVVMDDKYEVPKNCAFVEVYYRSTWTGFTSPTTVVVVR